ncbi:MAG: SMC-Scp complex subunit ScpB [Pirellula sp.]|jgi:segregation and condensation protein B|nr:SMC-Scp complex subunit ScpB [Pirellula sp.]
MVDESKDLELRNGSEISLEDLSRAFANVMQLPHAPSISSLEAGLENRLPVGETSVLVTPSSILEAVLFVGAPETAGVTRDSLLGILKGLTQEELDQEVSDLNRIYEQSKHPWRIVADHSGYALHLVGPMESVLDRLQATPRDHTLSQNAVDCLSLIAYQPGISKHQLETQWGQSAGTTLNYLVKKSLVRVEKNSDRGEDRYFTTDRFLEILGIDSLDDLPQGEEL